MAVIKHSSKKGWWYITVSQGAKGKKLYFPFEGTREDALIYDKQINAQIKGERLTIWPTIEQCLPAYTVHYRTIATDEIVQDMLSCMRRCLLPHFGRLQAQQIVTPLVRAYISERLLQPATGIKRNRDGKEIIQISGRTVSHRTVEKELNYLSAMLKWMHEDGHAPARVTVVKPSKAKTQPKTARLPLTLAELDNFLAKTPDNKKVLILLMTDAGLRQTEALTLKTTDIDLAGRLLVVRGKGGKVVVYPILTKRLHAELSKALHGNNGPWLSVNPDTDAPYGSLKTMIRGAAMRAGITKAVTHHILRHTFSNLVMRSGASTEARSKLMRHSSLAATQHYTHVDPEWLEQQAAGFVDMVEGASLSGCGEMVDGAGI